MDEITFKNGLINLKNNYFHGTAGYVAGDLKFEVADNGEVCIYINETIFVIFYPRDQIKCANLK